MKIEFVMHDDCSLQFNEDHPIFQTPLVKNVLECGQDDGEDIDEDEDGDHVVQIPLQQFDEKHFRAFVVFLEDIFSLVIFKTFFTRFFSIFYVILEIRSTWDEKAVF